MTPPGGLNPAPHWWANAVRRKGHLDRRTLITVGTLAGVPLLIVLARVLAMPGAEDSPLAALVPLRALGAFLNQHFAFDWVPPGDRPAILFLLLLPTGALFVVVFRLVLGLRVLGLRAILLAIGFQAIGILPSLALMLVVVAAIALIRPWIRRMQLPMYARITFILSFAVLIMIGAALIAPWLGSDTVWKLAFFPVIITAMIAESVVKTLEKDDLVLAAWRGVWTIVLALFLAVIDGPATRLSYHFPELILTQLMLVVLIAEFFDLRLLEEWPARLSRYTAGVRVWYSGPPKVAVVWNRSSPGSIRPLVEALEQEGFAVRAFEGDARLPIELGQYLLPLSRGAARGIVLNLATGRTGQGRALQVPALLEMAGFPYSGPGPMALAGLTDRFVLMARLQQARVPVPRHAMVSHLSEIPTMPFPASVRPPSEPEARRVIVRSRRLLRGAVRKVRGESTQPVVIEEIVVGRKISVALLGNETVECLPLVETRDGRRICPAPLDEVLANRIRTLARAAYAAAGCRDYARIEVRLPASEQPTVVDVKWAALLGRKGAFMTAARAAGYEFGTVLRRIVAEAAQRHVSARQPPAPAEITGVVPLSSRQAAG